MSEKSDKDLTVREIRATYDGTLRVPLEVLNLSEGEQFILKFEFEGLQCALYGELKQRQLKLHFEFEHEKPNMGDWEAIRRTFGRIDAPWYDPIKFDRDDIYS